MAAFKTTYFLLRVCFAISLGALFYIQTIQCEFYSYLCGL